MIDDWLICWVDNNKNMINDCIVVNDVWKEGFKEYGKVNLCEFDKLNKKNI